MMHRSFKFTKFPEVKLLQNLSVSEIALSYLHLCFHFWADTAYIIFFLISSFELEKGIKMKN